MTETTAPRSEAEQEAAFHIFKPLIEATAELDIKDLETFTAIGLLILATMEAQTGTAILMCDQVGNGSAQLIAVGNPLLIQPLLGAAAEAAQTLEQMSPGGVH
jgi:hypothetical protein